MLPLLRSHEDPKNWETFYLFGEHTLQKFKKEETFQHQTAVSAHTRGNDEICEIKFRTSDGKVRWCSPLESFLIYPSLLREAFPETVFHDAG